MDGSVVTATSFKYRAFISYSHRDRKWAEWLHKAVERYRVPKPLIGQPGRDSPILKQIFPVFRDRDELASSADLSASIRAALRDSAGLIVVCSPAAAKASGSIRRSASSSGSAGAIGSWRSSSTASRTRARPIANASRPHCAFGHDRTAC